MNEFAINIKYLRNALGFSQQQVANLLGIRQTTYSDYERGRSEATIGVLKKLAYFYRVPTDVLIGFKFPLALEVEAKSQPGNKKS